MRLVLSVKFAPIVPTVRKHYNTEGINDAQVGRVYARSVRKWDSVIECLAVDYELPLVLIFVEAPAGRLKERNAHDVDEDADHA